MNPTLRSVSIPIAGIPKRARCGHNSLIFHLAAGHDDALAKDLR